MTLYRGGGLSRVFCASRTLPSCSCLAIAAQETFPFVIPKGDDNNRFFKSGPIWPPRDANFSTDCCKRVGPGRRRQRRPPLRQERASDRSHIWQPEGPTGSILKPTGCFGRRERRLSSMEPSLTYERRRRSDSRSGDAPERRILAVVLAKTSPKGEVQGTAKRKPGGVRRVAATSQTVIPAKAGIHWGLKSTWIPAFAGMTDPYPIAATLRVLLSDGSVTSFRSSPGRSRSRILASRRASVAQNRTLRPCRRLPFPGS